MTASFIAQYTVTATAGAGGTISPASATVNAGDTTTFALTPKSGYVVAGATGCGGSLANGVYTTGMINAACTVTATFSPAFTFVGGGRVPNVSAVYGVPGVTAGTNFPGSRDAAITWTDASGDLWMFGGFSGYTGALDPTVGNFEGGTGREAVCPQGVYGTLGVAAVTNVPPPRVGSMQWTDASGNVWLFGGGGCDSAGAFVATTMWTWLAGSNTFDATGDFGTQGLAAATNIPGARAAPLTWKGATGTVWLFGGFQYDDPTNTRLEMSDLWTYPTQ